VIDDVPFHKVSVRHALTKKSTIAVLHQPFRTCEMTLPGAACSGRLAYRVDAENQKSCLVPLGTVAFGIEETTIGDKMFFVIVGQRVRAGRLVGEHGARRSSANSAPPEWSCLRFRRGYGRILSKERVENVK
jgi:hypothetical protein